jgi:hypothetical protein
MSRTISNPQMVLRPQDVVVLLRLSLGADGVPTYAALAEELKLTASEIHAGSHDNKQPFQPRSSMPSE